MNRRFSTFIKSSGSKEQSSEDTSNFALDEDAESKVTLNADVPLPPPVLKYKRLDHYYSKWGKTWKYRVCHVLHVAFVSRAETRTIEHELQGDRRGTPNQQSWR
jgi:hypothetical protein